MARRIYVAGSRYVQEMVAQSLPDLDVRSSPEPHEWTTLRDSDCLFIESSHEHVIAAAREHTPIVGLLLEDSAATPSSFEKFPVACVTRPRELRLAMRSAVTEYRVSSLISELNGPWSHDARGALGVAQLALKLIESSPDPSSPIQKIENGVKRLGYLMERLPSQIALTFDANVPQRHPSSLFPSLESYVKHLRLVHPRREIELLGGHLSSSSATERLVPFAAGLVDFALKLSSGRAPLKFVLTLGLCLEFDCECPNRLQPWNIQGKFGALDLRRPGTGVPYRLAEAARLAASSSDIMSLELTDRGLSARVELT